MDPAISSLLRRVQAPEHSVGNTHTNINVGARKGLKNIRVGIKELDFGDTVGLQELHHLVGWKWVRSHGAPVHPHSSNHRSHGGSGDEEGEEEARKSGGGSRHLRFVL